MEFKTHGGLEDFVLCTSTYNFPSSFPLLIPPPGCAMSGKIRFVGHFGFWSIWNSLASLTGSLTFANVTKSSQIAHIIQLHKFPVNHLFVFLHKIFIFLFFDIRFLAQIDFFKVKSDSDCKKITSIIINRSENLIPD